MQYENVLDFGRLYRIPHHATTVSKLQGIFILHETKCFICIMMVVKNIQGKENVAIIIGYNKL